MRPFIDYSFSKIKEVAEFWQKSEEENSRLDSYRQSLPEEFEILAHGCY